MFKILVSSALLVLYTPIVLAGASYDSEKKVVILKSPELNDTWFGQLTIYNKKNIEIFGRGFDKSTKTVKWINMCGKEPTLGLMFLNGKLVVDTKVPKVTNVTRYTSEDEGAKKANAAGWVRSFVLTGDDAEDLLDLLYEYKSVGFSLTSQGCKATETQSTKTLSLDFETKGLERAMNRIK